MTPNFIVEMILRGDLTEGSTLSERQVADLYKVSQVKARECIKDLTAYKIVEQIPQQYSKIVTFNDLQKQQIFAHRYQSECYAIEQIVARLSSFPEEEQRKAILQPLRDEMEKMEKAGEEKDFVAFTHADMHFHSAIAKIINFDLYVPWIENLFVSYFLATQSRVFFGNSLLNKPQPGEIIFEESGRILTDHERIFDAILDGSKEKALKALTAHLADAEKHWERALQRKNIVPAKFDPKTNLLTAYPTP